jgi:hypothetical protein
MLAGDVELQRQLFFHWSSLFATVGAGLRFTSFNLGRNELSSILSGGGGRSASLPANAPGDRDDARKNQRATPPAPPSRPLKSLSCARLSRNA